MPNDRGPGPGLPEPQRTAWRRGRTDSSGPWPRYARNARVGVFEAVFRRREGRREARNKGDEELDRGEGIAYTAEMLKAITESAVSAIRSSKPIDPDVLPETHSHRARTKG